MFMYTYYMWLLYIYVNSGIVSAYDVSAYMLLYCMLVCIHREGIYTIYLMYTLVI